MSRVEAFKVFANRDLLLLWLGQVVSQAGTRVYQIAMLWWLLAKNPGGSGMQLGYFMVLGAIPSIVFVKPIGRLIERSRSRLLLVTCDVLAAAVVSVVTWLLYADRMSVEAAYIAGFLVPLVQAVFNPTLNKSIAEIAPPELVGATVALQSSTQSMANFGGAVLGAIMVDAVGIPAVSLFNAASYLVSAVCLAIIPFRYARPPATTAGGDTVAGWAVLEQIPGIKGYLIGFGLANFFSTPTLIVLPVYTHQVLKASAGVLGQLEAALWLGLVAGAFASGFTRRLEDPRQVACICIMALGLSLAVPGLIVNRFVYMAMLAIAGLALGVNNVRFVSLFQTVVPPGLKGRFFAVLQATIGFTFPAAYLVFGLLTSRVDPKWVCVIQGAGTMLVAFYFLGLPDPTKEGELV
jgi:hypothetical protein